MDPADLLAPALGIALSPFGAIPAILLLFTPTPRANAAAFLAGWALGVLAGFLLAAGLSDLLAGREPGPWPARLRAVVGATLLLLAVRQAWRRDDGAAVPGWMASIAASRPPGAARLGLLLSAANPKVLLLAAAGGLGAAGAGAVPGGGLGAAALKFAAVASLPAMLPLLLHLAGGAAVLLPLDRARRWLICHNAMIMAVVMAAIGGLLLSKGLT